MTTTMPNMGKTIEAFIDADLREEVKIMVGGAPVTQEFADDMGADGYGKDAMACVELAKRLLEERRVEVESLIDARFPLREAVEAFAYSRRPGVVKVLLDIAT